MPENAPFLSICIQGLQKLLICVNFDRKCAKNKTLSYTLQKVKTFLVANIYHSLKKCIRIR